MPTTPIELRSLLLYCFQPHRRVRFIRAVIDNDTHTLANMLQTWRMDPGQTEVRT